MPSLTPEQRDDLLPRLRSATGPDREIDAVIMGLFYVQDERHIGGYVEHDDYSEEPVKDRVWVDPATDKWVSTAAYDFTSSVDATLTLVERCLPGWRYCMDGVVGDWAEDVYLLGPEYCSRTGLGGSRPFAAPTLPLALLMCLVSALGEEVQP